MYRLPHQKKITGLPQIYILTHSLRDLTSPSFCLQAEYAAYQGRREQVSMVVENVEHCGGEPEQADTACLLSN